MLTHDLLTSLTTIRLFVYTHDRRVVGCGDFLFPQLLFYLQHVQGYINAQYSEYRYAKISHSSTLTISFLEQP